METGEASNTTQYDGGDNQRSFYQSAIPVQQEEPFQETFENFGDIPSSQGQQHFVADDVQTLEDKSFEAFMEANQPLYEGCSEETTKLYLASCILRWKTDFSISDNDVDDIAGTIKRILPCQKTAPELYYETKKITKTLGLPVHKIDVCENNCMLFWTGDDAKMEQCKFCLADRFHPWNGQGEKIPKQRMFYLPITDRLKRLYQCEATARHMRWHAGHVADEGTMDHPSDGFAWKHFQNVYPEFAGETRNIYLGLSTDDFNPLGLSGKAH